MTVNVKYTLDGPAHYFRDRLMVSTELGNDIYGWTYYGGRYWATVSYSNSGLTYLTNSDGVDTGVCGINIPEHYSFSKVVDADGENVDFSKFAYVSADQTTFETHASVYQYAGYPWYVSGSGVWSWKTYHYFKEVIGWNPPEGYPRYPVYKSVAEPYVQEGQVTLTFDGVTEGESSKQKIGSVPPQQYPPSNIGDRVITGVGYDNFKCVSFQFDVPIEQMFQ